MSGSSVDSDSSSDTSDCSKRHPRPQVASNLAPLGDLRVQRMVDDPMWQQDPRDFQQRANVARYSLPAQSSVSSSTSAASRSSSMALSTSSRNSYNAPIGSPPSLTGSRSTLTSRSSAQTSRAGSMLRSTQDLLEQGEDDLLVRPMTLGLADWHCCFGFLGCRETFDSRSSWDIHCRAHFHGQLPRTVQCPFACQWYFTATSGQEAWQQRWIHIVNQHPYGGQISGRPPTSLIQHLWRQRIISDAEEQELRSYGFLRHASVYLQSHNTQGNRRERRNRETRFSSCGTTGSPYADG